jgi:glycine cleavage system H protein
MAARRQNVTPSARASSVQTTTPHHTSKGPTPIMQVRYSKDHVYITVEDGLGTVGITNHAQEKLSDVTFVELPHVGQEVKKGGAVSVVESVKAASDLYSPVSGEILGVNEALKGKPELVNEDAEGAGWIFRIKLTEPSELDTLLDREAYLAYVREQG